MEKWLERADAATIGQASTLLFVTLLRLEELASLRRQAKAVVDALDEGELEDARNLLAQVLARTGELAAIGRAVEKLAKRGP